MDIVWDMLAQRQISGLQAQAGQAEVAVDQVARQIGDLEWKLKAVILLNQALIEILVQNHGMTEEQVLAKATEIDHRDGEAEAAGAKCAKCQRPYSNRLDRCLYCGSVRENSSIVSKLHRAT